MTVETGTLSQHERLPEMAPDQPPEPPSGALPGLSTDRARALPPRDPFPLSECSLALGTLALIGGSVGLFIGTLIVSTQADYSEFLGGNALPTPQRNGLLLALAAGAGSTLLMTLGYLAVRRRKAVPVLTRASQLLSPLGLVFLLPSLFSYSPWHSRPVTYLVQLTVAVLLLERAFRRSFSSVPEAVADWFLEKLPKSRRLARYLPIAVVIAGSIFYSIYFSYYTILNHQRLGTSGFDLGINVNWCYNALHGQPARCPVLFGPDGGHFLGNHAIFAFVYWLPIYAIKPGAEGLLIFQATTTGFAAATLYLFASTQIPRWSAVVVAYAYLFFAPLHGPNFYDYHELMPPLLVHFLLYWAIATRRNRLVPVLVVALWSFREDVAVGTAVLGVFLLITGIRPKMGLLMAVASGVWFILIKFLIMPMFWQTWFASIYKELQAPGAGGYGSVVQTILVNPSYFLTTMLKEEKLVYFLHMFAPLALLPARRPALMLLAIPGFAFSLLTTGYPPTLSIAFQYTCHAIPYIFAASVLMLRVLGRGEGGAVRRRAVLSAIALGVASHSYVFGAILQHNTFIGGFSKIEFVMTEEEKLRYQTMKQMAAMIPKEASVAATENEVPHVAVRMNAYTLKDGPADADYVLLRQGSGYGHAASMFTNHRYGLVMEGHGLYLFKKGHESPRTSAALSALGLPQGPPRK